MSTHEELRLPWPEGAGNVRLSWGKPGRYNAGELYAQVIDRPLAPAPQGWEGPPGSDWHDYVGKVCMFSMDRRKWKAGVLRDVAGGDELPYWNDTNGHLYQYCRPLTVAEAGVTTP